jgi:hypothetical protein
MGDNKVDDKDSQYEALLNSNFKQQKLSAWRPVPTIISTTITFIIFGIIFIIIGIIIIIFSNNIREHSTRYDLECDGIGKLCTLEMYISDDLKAPVMFYYQLSNFYQNHRRYVKSKSNAQLGGQLLASDKILSDCDPVYLNKHLDRKYPFEYDNAYIAELESKYTVKELQQYQLDPEASANPCGLIAKSVFNDTYNLYEYDDFNRANKRAIPINSTGIAWQSDIDMKYSLNDNYKNKMWQNTTDEHFMVWMRTSGLPNFRKLWGRIQTDLKAGKYIIEIDNNYAVSQFEGEKFFVLSTVNAFGGKNYFLGISYISVGSICLIMALLFFFGYKSHSKTS